MEQKLKVGIIGATGYVGQRFITLLADHPWFEIVALCASPRSAGKTYEEAVDGRWKLDIPCPEFVKKMVVYGTDNIEEYCKQIDFTFCAVDMKKDEIKALEEKIAKLETPVISNNSANRWTEDVPMVIPEINANHIELIEAQKKRLGTKRGFIAVKPNCSIQSYVPALTPFLKNGIKAISVCTYQAISGAGKTFDRWPEMVDNLIPYIGGEEEKSEKEPLKVWGEFAGDHIELAKNPVISAQCIRVPVSDGHLATVSVKFKKKPAKEEMLKRWAEYKGLPQELDLPHAPKQFITYMEEDNRPQTKLDRDIYGGMGITVGRLREDCIFDYKFVCLSHNTLRGAAGGAMLSAEMLYKLGYLY